MLEELLKSVKERSRQRELQTRVLGAILASNGGHMEVPFKDIEVLTGGLGMEVDTERKIVILTSLPAEESEESGEDV